MEKVVGKAWMGILASVLIFASLIFFATVMIPLLSDTAKMVIMYAVSIAILVAGLVLLNRRGRAVYVAISSCGLGAVYLSMLMSNIYFEVINDITLYLFVLVWAVGVAYLSRTKSRVFLVIGQIGLVISVILGVISCGRTDDNTKLLILTVFFLLSAAVYELFNPQQKLINLSFETAGFVVMVIYTVIAAELPNLTVAVLLCVAAFQIVRGAAQKVKAFAVFDILYVLAAVLLIIALFSEIEINEYAFSFLLYIVAAANIAAVHLLYREKMSDDGMIVISVCNACVMAAAFTDREPCLYLFLVPLVLMALGFVFRSTAYKIESYVSLAVVGIFGDGELLYRLLEIAFLCGALALSVAAVKKADAPRMDWMKTVTFLFLHFSIFKAVIISAEILRESAGWEFSGDIERAVILALLLVTNLVFRFALNKKGDKVLLVCTYISSAFLMISSTVQLYSISISNVDYYITLLVAAAIFANNTYRFIRSGDAKYQLYGVFKVTAFLVIVLTSLHRASVLLSVALLVLSILWILAGFGLSAKAVRIYGLVITNISIVKLILIDITYNSTLEKAAGFFICGILCFVISFIYSRIVRNVETAGQ
jgi:preprotein translocase subunit Sss1